MLESKYLLFYTKFNPQIFNEILNHESSYADDNERVYYENQSET